MKNEITNDMAILKTGEVIDEIRNSLLKKDYSIVEKPEGKPFVYITVKNLPGVRITLWEDGKLDLTFYPVLPEFTELLEIYKETKMVVNK